MYTREDNGPSIMVIGAGIVGVLVAIFLLSYYFFGLNAFFAPKQAALDNQVYHNSAQYNDGMIQRLDQLQESYIESKNAGNQAGMDSIRSIVKHEFAAYPEDRLNPDLKAFLHQMKGV